MSLLQYAACALNANRSDQGCRGDRADSWDLRESLAGLILSGRFLDEESS